MANNIEKSPAKKWSMSTIKNILLEKTVEILFLAVVFTVGIYVQNKIFEAEIIENKKQIEALTGEVGKTVALLNQHLVWSEGRSVSLDELRRRIELVEVRIEAMRERELRGNKP